LPSLVEHENLLEGNSKLAMSGAAAEIAGPSLTGILVQTITAPIAILFDALSFLVSAVSVASIRKREPAPHPGSAAPHPIAGLRFLFGHPLLRAIACYSLTAYFFFGFIGPLYVLFAVRELGLTPALLGVAIAMGGVGSLIGSSIAPLVRLRFGVGRTFIGAVLAMVAFYALIPLAHGSAAAALLFLIVQQLFGDCAHTTYVINEITLRQRVAPAEVLGRVNAAMQLMTRGMFPAGAAIGGFLGEFVGVRTTLSVAVAGILAASFWLIASPLRSWKTGDDAL